MVYLHIDSVEVASVSGAINIGFDAEQMVSLDSARSSRVVAVEVAVNSDNFSIFGGEGYLHTAERFNATEHLGELISEGLVVVSGRAVLSRVAKSGAEMVVGINIILSECEWIESCCDQMFNTLPLEYSQRLLLSTIYDSWVDTTPVKFFPVHRDTYVDSYTDSLSESVVRVRSVDDYHPFINIYDVLNCIFTRDGYQLESQFIESDWFKRLYMSGAYVSQSTESVSSAMDFYVKGSETKSATASLGGRVYLSDNMSYNSVGNFIDVETIDSDSECYSRNNCLKYDDGSIIFEPLTEVSVGFEFRVKYRTPHIIDSRTRLAGFDRFYTYDSNLIDIDIPNSYIDQRESTIMSNHIYRALVFDHTDGNSYRITGMNGAVSLRASIFAWTTRTDTFTIDSSWSDGDWYDLRLEIYGESGYEVSDLDWALYDGYVEESGTTIVDLTFRTPPESYTPTSTFELSFMYVESRDDGFESATFELLEGSTLSPVFAEYPGYGSSITFEDVSQHAVKQSVVIEALVHLFNLRFFTNERSRRVYIDPFDTFVEQSESFDWSDKVLIDQGLIYEDQAMDLYRTRTWGYQREDGYVNRDNEEGGEMYGDWSISIENYATQDSEMSYLNPLFSPTKLDDDGLPIVGDRDDPLTVGTLEFSPRILSYEGVDSVDNSSVPILVFHSVQHDLSLCFEDRDGVDGLNRFYANQVEYERRGEYVTLYMALTHYDISSLLYPLEGRASVLSNFKLLIDGEWAVCRLVEVESYDLDEQMAKCRFMIIK